jgi:hypothetical protein
MIFERCFTASEIQPALKKSSEAIRTEKCSSHAFAPAASLIAIG